MTGNARNRRRIVPVAAAVAVVAAIVWALLPKPVAVDVTPVTRGAVVVTVDEDGRTRVKERYVVSSPLAGRLRRIELDPGDPVAAGTTLLAVIEPSDPTLLDPRARAEAEARVRAAESAVGRAEALLGGARAANDLAAAELGRAKRLFETEILSRQELDQAEERARVAADEVRAADFAREVARFELEQARAALGRGTPDLRDGAFEIHAPVDGRVLRVFEESAVVVGAGTPLVEVGDPAELEVEIDVLSSDAVRVVPGARVSLEHWGGGAPLRGRVRRIEPGAFTKISALGVEEQRVNVIVDLEDPPGERERLGDGFRVEARIVVAEADDVLKVASGALFREDDRWALFRVENGHARLVPVGTGLRGEAEVQVTEGVSEGDSVVLHPSDRVADGVAVTRRRGGR